MKLYDITLPITNDMPVWPGDQPVSLMMNTSIAKGDDYNMTGIQMGAHTGTHIDAPYHFLEDGATIDAIPIETFIGPCVVIEVDSEVSIEEKDFRKHDLIGHSRVLFKTRNSQLHTFTTSVFTRNYVSLGIDAARYLVEMEVMLVGIDYLSIESFRSTGSPVHKLLLRNNITILEGLNLSGVKAGEYELLCMPLKLQGCEGAPARVILREMGR
ncbi:MAG: cyclase family protein [Dissulfurispiraceae bacterium]|jgi:arylformamidase